MGDITPLANYLSNERPVGWREELAKIGVENMADAAFSPHLINAKNWHINMRLLNRTTVIPKQVNKDNKQTKN